MNKAILFKKQNKIKTVLQVAKLGVIKEFRHTTQLAMSCNNPSNIT